jgi:hypothetical protein
MLRCGENWQPTTVNRVIETYPTSTRVAKVKTDEGTAFLKGMGNPAGNQSLAMELACAELACLLGLFVPDFAILDLAEIEVPMRDCNPMEFGPAFASREFPCITSDGSATLLEMLSDPADLSLLVIFDTWIRNLDRCPPPDYLDPTPRRDNLCFTPKGRKLKLMVLDHSHCFVEGAIEDEIGDPRLASDPRIYGHFPEFEPYLNEASLRRAADKMASIDAGAIAEIVHSIPIAWGPSGPTRAMWVEHILQRQEFVADAVIDALVAQGRLRV